MVAAKRKGWAASLLASVALAVAMVMGAAGTAWAVEGGQWKQQGSSWWYQNDDGSYPSSTWERIGGKWYHFDGSGWMQTGWLKLGGTWYHLGGSGAMSEGWIKDGGTWYWLTPGSGAMATGWYRVSGEWEWSDSSGAWHDSRWVSDSGGWWYSWAGGGYPAASDGWQKIDGKWYLFNDSGWMRTGWVQLGDTWYHLGGAGAMSEGWVKDGGTWYWLAPGSGAMAENRWIDGVYWVGADGAMATDAWVDGGRYYVGADGRWVSNTHSAIEPSPASDFTYSVGDYLITCRYDEQSEPTDLPDLVGQGLDTLGLYYPFKAISDFNPARVSDYLRGTFAPLPAGGAVPEGFVHCVSGHGVYITDYLGDDDVVVVPDAIDGLPVVYVGIDGKAKCSVDLSNASHLRTLVLKNVRSVVYEGAASLEGITVYYSECPGFVDYSMLSNLEVVDVRAGYRGLLPDWNPLKSPEPVKCTAEHSSHGYDFHGLSLLSLGATWQIDCSGNVQVDLRGVKIPGEDKGIVPVGIPRPDLYLCFETEPVRDSDWSEVFPSVKFAATVDHRGATLSDSAVSFLRDCDEKDYVTVY